MKKTKLVTGFVMLMILTMNTNLFSFAGGTGTELDPYQVSNATELNSVRDYCSSYADYFIQTMDIDLAPYNTGDGWVPINSFSGTYDGDGNTIDGLFINSNDNYVALFGVTNSWSYIKNLSLTNVNVIAGNSSIRVAALVGKIDGHIVSCYSTGDVSGGSSAWTGGLAGGGVGYITNSYSRVNVVAASIGGGLVGYAFNADVKNCYSTGSVSGTGGDLGGLIGGAGSSTITKCFYDELPNNGIGTFSTTEDMKTQSTYGGWDFTTIWEMNGENYPNLRSNPEPTLPVVLSTFTAQYLNNTPILCWVTQSETDNMGWFVYRNVEEEFTTSEKISEFIEGYGTTTQQQSYIYEDTIENPEVGDKYYYWLESIDYSGMVNHYDKVTVMQIPDIHNPDPQIAVPSKYGLQSGPNPFNSNLTVSYMLPKTDMVRIEIYNMHGQLIDQFNEGLKTADKKYTLRWDGKDLYGQNVSSGVLLIKLITSEGSETKKAILLR